LIPQQSSSRSNPAFSKRFQVFAASIVIIAGGVIAYHNCFKGQFLYDDIHAIQSNPYIRSLKTSFGAPRQASLAGRPIASLSFALTYKLFSSNPATDTWDINGPPPRLDPRGYHAVNLVIHVFAALCLFGIVRRTLLSSNIHKRFEKHAILLAASISLIWVTHPLQTQSVTYIIQRTESLCGLFYFLTLYCAIRAFEIRERSIWVALAVLACALGMGTKEVMVTAPLAVYLYDVIFFSNSYKDAIRRHWSLYLGLCMTWFILLGLLADGPRSQSVGAGVVKATPWIYLRSEAGVLLHYLMLVFWPAQLCFDYDWQPALYWRDYVPQCIAISVLLSITVFGLIRRFPLAYFGVWFFLVLAPTSSFVPINDLAFEQRMYLPLAGVVSFVVMTAYYLLVKVPEPIARGAGVYAVLGLTILLAIRTIHRNADYHDAAHMWDDVTRQRPENARAWSALGTEYVYGPGAESIAKSVQCYERAVALNPREFKYLENLGRALGIMKQPNRAIDAYQRALAISPGAFSINYNLGVVLYDVGRFQDAALAYNRALHCRGGEGDYRAHFNLGNALLQLGRRSMAEYHFKRALQIKPAYEKARNALESMRAHPSTG
jgi:Tfp pilus assembly protein PilF